MRVEVLDGGRVGFGKGGGILRKKFPGLLPDGPGNGNTIPPLMSSEASPDSRPTLGANTSPTGAANDPHTPQDLIRTQPAAPAPRSANSYLPWTQDYKDYFKGLSTAQKLGTILMTCLMV